MLLTAEPSLQSPTLGLHNGPLNLANVKSHLAGLNLKGTSHGGSRSLEPEWFRCHLNKRLERWWRRASVSSIPMHRCKNDLGEPKSV